jgi:DNA/RNA-binding domain of Phe-tRNA-synthetase-like protein
MENQPHLTVDSSLEQLHVGAVWAEQVQVDPAGPELQTLAAEVAARALQRGSTAEFEAECQQIRQMLRHGKFKASGRSKPAQEYLLRCVVQTGSLPAINAPVDVINAISLDCNLPISLLSLRKCSRDLTVTRGTQGQSYVFNATGQVLDIEDLIVVADRSATPPRPVGSPIKDSMVGKIDTLDRDLIAVIYAPRNSAAIDRCRQASQALVAAFRNFCGAKHCEAIL